MIQPTILFMDDALVDLNTGVYAVLRQKRPTLVSGRAVADPAPVMLQIQGCLQPASKVDLLRLPETRRTSDMRAFYSPIELFIQSDANASDQVTVGVDVFEVSECEPWGDGAMGSNYWRVVLLRVARLNAGQP